MEDSAGQPWQPIVDRLALDFPDVARADIIAKVQQTWAMFAVEDTDEEGRLRAVEWMVRSELPPPDATPGDTS